MADATGPQTDLSAVLERLDRQEREIADLRAQLDTARATPVTPGAATRRNFLRSAAVGGVAAAAATALNPGSAAAADGDALLVGNPNQATSKTRLTYTSPDPINTANIFTVQDTNVSTGANASIGATATGGAKNAIYAGVGVRDNSFITGHALIAYANDDGRSNVYLASTRTTAPTTDNFSHAQGELIATNLGDLWYCVTPGADGTQAQFRRLAGQDTAGSFHAISPARAYDSRRSAAPDATPLTSGQNRVISIKDRRDVASGSIVETDVVPAGSTAIAYNVTVVGTSGRAFLSVAPGDAGAITASTVNWDVSTLSAVANSSVVKLDTSRQIKVFCGGAGASTDVIIDIVGYYL